MIDRLTERVDELNARIAELERQQSGAPGDGSEERRIAAS